MSDAYYVLEITPPEGPAETREIREATVTVGRRQGDIVIPDSGASGRHAEIRFDGGAVRVQDVGSTNGTLFQGEITRGSFSLDEGQSFQIGRTRFRLASVHAPAPAPAPEPMPEEDEDKTVVARPAFDFDLEDEPAAAPPEPAPAPPEPEEPEKTAFLSADEPGPTQRAPAPPAEPPEPEEPEKTAFLSAEDPGPTQRAPAPRAAAPEPEPSAPPEPVEEAEATAWLSVPTEEEPEPAAPEEPAAGEGGEEKTAFLSAGGGAAEEDWTVDAAAWGQPVDAEAPTEEQSAPADAPDWAAAYIEGDGPSPGPSAPPASAGQGVRPQFSGTGGQIFGELIIGLVLTMITFGIYGSWFLVSLTRYMARRTTIGPTARGRVTLDFTGTGGQLFVKFFVGYVLTMLTLGIYGFWFATDVARFFIEHTEGRTPDGSRYQARFTLSGVDFFKACIVGAILTVLTLGIYAPWFICKVHALFKGHTHLYDNGEHVGTFEFHGEGGDLFGRFLVGYVLTVITLGIYGAWFQVSLKRFFTSYTTLRVRDRVLQGGFSGSGGELFLIQFIGVILIPLTLGLYFFWYVAKLVRFNLDHLVFQEIDVD